MKSRSNANFIAPHSLDILRDIENKPYFAILEIINNNLRVSY